MAGNIPVQQQQAAMNPGLPVVGVPTSVPVTLVTAMPMTAPPPLAQITTSSSVAGTTGTNVVSAGVPVVPPMNHPAATATPTVVAPTPTPKVVTSAAQSSAASAASAQSNNDGLVSRVRLQDLVREVDAAEQLDEDVEDLLLMLADDFVESTVNAACLLAKHRKATTVDVKDVQLHLERNWNMWIPGFGTDELRPYKRAPVTEAHKQRLALIRKAIKKY